MTRFAVIVFVALAAVLAAIAIQPAVVVVERAQVPLASTTTTAPPLPNMRAIVAPTTSTSVAPARRWSVLADCESGVWDAAGQPVAASARWDDVTGLYEGGLHFTHDTWVGAGGRRFAEHANQAAPADQIAVAERVLATQGAGAWPVCGSKIGLHR